MIGRKNAKECLLGLKEELFNELEEEGYLRSSPEYDLKINYEEWLYAEVMAALGGQQSSEKAAERVVE